MCEIEDQLRLIHKWVHRTYMALDKEGIEQAYRLGHRILDLLNESEGSNGVKLIALYDAINSGIEHMEAHEPEPDDNVTIQ